MLWVLNAYGYMTIYNLLKHMSYSYILHLHVKKCRTNMMKCYYEDIEYLWMLSKQKVIFGSISCLWVWHFMIHVICTNNVWHKILNEPLLDNSCSLHNKEINTVRSLSYWTLLIAIHTLRSWSCKGSRINWNHWVENLYSHCTELDKAGELSFAPAPMFLTVMFLLYWPN